MKAYSMDLRERIVLAVAAGTPLSVVARTFSVARATVVRYVERQQRDALPPRRSPGRPPRLGPDPAAALRAHLAPRPDAPLAEHVEAWAQAHGVRVSVATMQRAIARLGWTRKKRR